MLVYTLTGTPRSWPQSEIVAHPSWRASALGVYRFWRDSGYAGGALLAGLTADRFGIQRAVGLVAAITFFSGWRVALRMRETFQRKVGFH